MSGSRETNTSRSSDSVVQATIATRFEPWDSITVLTVLADGTTIYAIEGERNLFGEIGEKRDDGTRGIANCTVLAVYGLDDVPGDIYGQRLDVRTPRGYHGCIWARFAVLEGRRILVPAVTTTESDAPQRVPSSTLPYPGAMRRD